MGKIQCMMDPRDFTKARIFPTEGGIPHEGNAASTPLEVLPEARLAPEKEWRAGEPKVRLAA
jgi:rubredoxin